MQTAARREVAVNKVCKPTTGETVGGYDYITTSAEKVRGATSNGSSAKHDASSIHSSSPGPLTERPQCLVILHIPMVNHPRPQSFTTSINPAFSRVNGAMLIAVALLGCACRSINSTRRRSGLQADVNGITGLAAMANISNYILTDFDD